MNPIIQDINAEQMKKKEIPDFSPGDTVIVEVKVTEGSRTRRQKFEGVVIAKRNRGLHSAFTVRKISHGVGVERVFLWKRLPSLLVLLRVLERVLLWLVLQLQEQLFLEQQLLL